MIVPPLDQEERGVPAAEGMLLPRQDGREAPLFLVMVVLAFLACLALLGAAGAWRSADAWSAALRNAMTARIEVPDNTDRDNLAFAAEEALRAVSGVRAAKAIDRARAQVLLRPWLGDAPLPDDLPLPLLIEIEVDPTPGLRPDGEALAKALQATGLAATVDDHSRWSADVSAAAETVRAGSLAALGLLATAAGAVIAFAARAAFLARHDIVEVLHLVGARDAYVARAFQRRFLGLGLRAGAVGALLAAAVGGCALWLDTQTLAGTPLLPGFAPDWRDLVVLAFVPVIAGIIAMLTARGAVMKALKSLR